MRKEEAPVVLVDCEIYGTWECQEPTVSKTLKIQQKHTRTKRNVEKTDSIAATEEIWLERVKEIYPPDGVTDGHRAPDITDKVAIWDILDNVHWVRKKISAELEDADDEAQRQAADELKNLRRGASGTADK